MGFLKWLLGDRSGKVVHSGSSGGGETPQEAERRLVRGAMEIGDRLDRRIRAFSEEQPYDQADDSSQQESFDAAQVSDRGVAWILKRLGQVEQELFMFMEPGTRIMPLQEMFLPNLMAEFRGDSKLGIVHGQGGSHALIRTAFLKTIVADCTGQIHNYAMLVAKFRQKGYKVKRVGYIRFETPGDRQQPRGS